MLTQDSLADSSVETFGPGHAFDLLDDWPQRAFQVRPAASPPTPARSPQPLMAVDSAR